MAEKGKKKVAVIEDDPVIRKEIRELLERYDQLDLVEATNAGEAMRLLFSDLPGRRPDALILDLMMPYGSVTEELDARSDPDQIETGVRILERLREAESQTGDRLWVSVITARNNPQLIQRLRQLLHGFGRIYTKPFNDLELENDLACVLGIESLVNPNLLPRDYVELNSGSRGGP